MKGQQANTRKGQMILMATVLMAILILMAALLVYASGTIHLEFEYQPYKEMFLAIDSDFRNALTTILAKVTSTYNGSAEMNSPRALANRIFTLWLKSVQDTYAGRGVRMRTTWNNVSLQPAKTLYGMTYSPKWVYNLTKLYWHCPQSISSIQASVSVDIVSGGYMGWRTSHLILLNLTIDVPSIRKADKGNELTFNIVVLREGNIPVSDLLPKNVNIFLFDPSASGERYCWRKGQITSMIYNGGGNYTINVKPQFYDAMKAEKFWSYYLKFLVVNIQDNRGVSVEGCSYSNIEYTINEAIGASALKTWETYVFELLPNGTMRWFEKNLLWPSESNIEMPPLPPVPMKQLRVFANRGGTKMIEIPFQTEIWTDNYLFPTFKFSEWRKRFTNGSKLVFQLYFPPSVSSQKVLVTWLDDADAMPPRYSETFMVVSDAPGLVYINNRVYVLSLLRDPVYFTLPNYPLLTIGRGAGYSLQYNASFSLLEYDTTDGYYRIPGGEWTVLYGPVRAVAFRNSTKIMEPSTSTDRYNEMLHRMIIYIPFNVSYFQFTVNAKWLRTVQLEYLSFYGMSANRTQKDGTIVSSFGSIQNPSNPGTAINGTYSNSGSVNHRDINNDGKNPSEWAAIYGGKFGLAISVSNSFINLLGSYGDKDQLLVRTVSDLKRMMRYDAISSGSGTVQTDPSKIINYKVAVFIFSGGSASNDYYDTNKWRNEPLKRSSPIANELILRHKMFDEETAPWLTSVSYNQPAP